MNKDEARSSVMGAISMAIKDATLQQGFEIICKNLLELEKENLELKKACDETQELLDKQIEATYKLDKENAELKNKYDTCLRENMGLKIHNTYIEKKHTQAKKIIGNLYAICKDNHYPNTSVLMEQAEQFLKESE